MARVSTKNQITVPVTALEAAGLRPGEDVVVRATGPGRLEVERVDDLIAEFAGSLANVYPDDALRQLRDEWTP